MNTNRVFPRTAERFGLIAKSEFPGATRIILSLKGVQCDFSIAGGLVEVTMTQIFRQENPKPLDCDYLFPLPADAAVYFCEADINGRVIIAQVRERSEAVKLAADKKAEGRRVMLVESERENLFTLTLNNLQPDDLIVVKLKYIQPVRFLADSPSIEIPLCPGVRYIPGNPLLRANRGRGTADDTDQVPDASRISPVRLDSSHPDAAYVEIRGTLDRQFVDLDSLMSPSHNVISRAEADMLTVRLSDKDEVPDRDFVLRWQENQTEAIAPRAWVHHRGEEYYALLEIRAPKAKSATVSPMDFYFLVDRSLSMAGIKWQKAALAVQSCVRVLAPEDRVMITLFGGIFNDFAERPLAPRELLADVGFQKLEQLPVVSATELVPALRHVLELAATHSPGRPKSLILITDAEVGNDAPVLKIMESAPDFPVHCFGIDISLNDALLQALASQQKGTFHSLNPADDVAGVVTKLAQTIRHPVLTDLKLSGSWDLAEASIPPMYSGQIHYLSARSQSCEGLELTAQNGSEARSSFTFTPGAAGGEAPYLRWCKNRILYCLARKREAEAIALSIKSNLICPLTAFITWDELEKVAIAQHSLVQPVFAPAAHYRVVEACQFMAEVETRCLGATANLQEDLMDSPFDADEAMIWTVSDTGGGAGLMHPDREYPVEQRREAFQRLFIKLCERCLHPEWMPLCERILAWTFENKNEASLRSKRLALLMCDLVVRSRLLEAWRDSKHDIAMLEAQIHEGLTNYKMEQIETVC